MHITYATDLWALFHLEELLFQLLMWPTYACAIAPVPHVACCRNTLITCHSIQLVPATSTAATGTPFEAVLQARFHNEFNTI